MHTKQTITIIGATGNMGRAISKSLSAGNYRLLLVAGDHGRLDALLNDIKAAHPGADAEAIHCSVDASWEAEIIIVAVPYQAEKEVAERIRQVANQKIVISIANPVNSSTTGLVTEPDTSAAEELQKLLPHSKVVKAFNTSFAAGFSTPLINGKQADVFIAGNEEEALLTVAELVTVAGFKPVIAGALSVSRTLENMQLLLMQLSTKYNCNGPAGWKILY